MKTSEDKRKRDREYRAKNRVERSLASKKYKRSLKGIAYQVRKVMASHSCPVCKELWKNKVFHINTPSQNNEFFSRLKEIVSKSSSLPK